MDNYTTNRHLPPEIRQQHIALAKKMLLEQGATQLQVAHTLGYNPKTICLWVKALGWRSDIAQLSKKRNIPVRKVNDSLSAFMMYLKKKHSDQYDQLEPLQKKFIRTLK